MSALFWDFSPDLSFKLEQLNVKAHARAQVGTNAAVYTPELKKGA